MFKWLKNKSTAFIRFNDICTSPRSYTKLSQKGYEENIIVYRCISLIAKSLCSIPLLLYDADDQECTDHPLLSLFKNPNEEMTYQSFMQHLTSYFLLSGNVYIWQTENKMYLLHPDRVSIEDEQFIYEVGYQKTKYSFDQILHIKNFHPRDDWYGFSAIQAAASSIDQHNAVGLHNLSLLQNGGRPSGALVVEEHLTHEQRKSMRKNLEELYQGKQNAGKIMLLEGNFKWHELGLSPKDLDFLPGKIIAAKEIATAFGVSPILVGITEDSTYSNYKEARLQLWEDTVLPLLDYFLSYLNQWFGRLYPGIRLAYDLDSINVLSQKREEIWQKLENCHFLTVNEKRQAVGYSPIDGGDVL